MRILKVLVFMLLMGAFFIPCATANDFSHMKFILTGTSVEINAGVTTEVFDVGDTGMYRIIQVTCHLSAADNGSIMISIDSSEGSNYDVDVKALSYSASDDAVWSPGEAEGMVLSSKVGTNGTRDIFKIKGTSITADNFYMTVIMEPTR